LPRCFPAACPPLYRRRVKNSACIESRESAALPELRLIATCCYLPEEPPELSEPEEEPLMPPEVPEPLGLEEPPLPDEPELPEPDEP
jgi:hypothetical protein